MLNNIKRFKLNILLHVVSLRQICFRVVIYCFPFSLFKAPSLRAKIAMVPLRVIFPLHFINRVNMIELSRNLFSFKTTRHDSNFHFFFAIILKWTFFLTTPGFNSGTLFILRSHWTHKDLAVSKYHHHDFNSLNLSLSMGTNPIKLNRNEYKGKYPMYAKKLPHVSWSQIVALLRHHQANKQIGRQDHVLSQADALTKNYRCLLSPLKTQIFS